jgi:hypothetical protein
VYIIIYLVNGVRHEVERFRSEREARAMLVYYVQPAWVEVLI